MLPDLKPVVATKDEFESATLNARQWDGTIFNQIPVTKEVTTEHLMLGKVIGVAKGALLLLLMPDEKFVVVSLHDYVSHFRVQAASTRNVLDLTKEFTSLFPQLLLY